MSEAARSRRDDGRYEPQVAVPGRGSAPSDPLAELARLVGQDDPFRNVFRPAAPATAPEPGFRNPRDAGLAPDVHHDPRDNGHHGAAAGYDDSAVYDEAGHAEAAHGEDGHDPDRHHQDGAYADGAYYDDDPAHHAEHDGYAEPHADEQHYAAEQAAHPDEAGLADEHFAPGYDPAALPDTWAQDGDWAQDGVAAERAGGPVRLNDHASKSAARRPIAVLAAVLVLTGGGLAASFLAKSPATSGAVATSGGRGAPTILAATGPTKVKADDGSTTAPEDQDVALLNKGGILPNGPVKIVSSQEQPADLGQLPKSDLAEGARPLPAPVPSPFPEPKKVKTFVVHPDGTMLSGDSAAAAPGRTSTAAPAPSTPGDAAASPLPATPATGVRGGTTPKSSAATPAAPMATIASLSADPALADPATTAAVPATRQSAPVKGPASYGVQLASSPVEADANAAFAKLKKRYPAQLGPYTATVHKAETGDKPVYRVRVGGMTQDEAKGLCTQLQSAGGACLVMHN